MWVSLPDRLRNRIRDNAIAPDGTHAFGNPRQPEEGQDRQCREDDRLCSVDPEPCVPTTFPEQPSVRIVRPHQGEEDQEPQKVNRDGWQDRIGEVSCRTERDTHEKVEKELGPQETLRRAVRKRKQNR